MSEIPGDIMATARTVADSEVNFGSYEVNALAIARAILAERKRCAEAARGADLYDGVLLKNSDPRENLRISNRG